MNATKRWALAALALVLVGAAAYYLTGRPTREPEAGPVAAPEFTYPDLSGRPVSLSSFRGQVVLVDFWATWCGPCEDELPDLKKLYAEYKDKGFTIIGVSMDAPGRPVVAPYVKAKKIPYPILVSKGEPPEGYPILGFPTAFLIDRQGTVRERYVGEMGYEDFSKDVRETLAH